MLPTDAGQDMSPERQARGDQGNEERRVFRAEGRRRGGAKVRPSGEVRPGLRMGAGKGPPRSGQQGCVGRGGGSDRPAHRGGWGALREHGRREPMNDRCLSSESLTGLPEWGVDHERVRRALGGARRLGLLPPPAPPAASAGRADRAPREKRALQAAAPLAPFESAPD